MTVVEAHLTKEGYEITARLRMPNGAKLVCSAEGPVFEEVQAELIAKIAKLLPPEKPEEPG